MTAPVTTENVGLPFRPSPRQNVAIKFSLLDRAFPLLKLGNATKVMAFFLEMLTVNVDQMPVQMAYACASEVAAHLGTGDVFQLCRIVDASIVPG